MRGTVGLRRCAATVTLAGALVALPATALAHVERTSYWPDPRPDRSVRPAAGGAVPTARSLASALPPGTPARRRPPVAFAGAVRASAGGGSTRVVCQPDSLALVRRQIAAAERRGFRDRPSEPLRRLSRHDGDRLLALNQRFAALCRYREIQPAVSASRNDDRVVIMPGTYTEPRSRAVPSFPSQCQRYRTTSDRGSGAVSYAYQYHCPNAQSLVAVIGRLPGPGQDPQATPLGRPDPHGIPNLGPCVRCNLQIEGSGPTPDGTVIDAGRVASGNHGPLGAKKDVGLKVDRGDGIVIRNMTVRHAAEHDVYILETDGYLMNRMKYFYGGEYGVLMFTSDHGLTDTCEGVGNGDSAVYPGGAPDTGARRDARFYPTARLNQTITHCDLHHNNLGYSGTMGNATHVVDNDFYDNTTGIATDSFFAGGHPGYPQDSAVFERNRIHANNFNVYAKGSDVTSAVPVPIGVGILIAGGDGDTVARNHIYDNWRRGTMLIAVPDAISCAPNPDQGAPPCTPASAATTSNGNRYHDNVMGRTPRGQVLPNGVDFWWDEFPTNTGNCWYDNVGSNGRADGITSDPAPAPVRGSSLPGFLPEDCAAPTNVGIGSPRKEAVLAGCVADFAGGTYDSTVCDWFAMPPKPSGAQGRAHAAASAVPGGATGPVTIESALCHLLGGEGGVLSCRPFRHRLG